jgi:shikimate kinase
MGCGKTTAGHLAADDLGIEFLDLDEYLEETHKMTITEMFAQFGETPFRMLETSAITEICETHKSGKGAIIALGGGVMQTPENVKILSENGVIVYIEVDFDTCFSRIKGSDRPLVVSKTRLALKKLYDDRKKSYLDNSKFTVYSTGDAMNLAKRIAEIYREVNYAALR